MERVSPVSGTVGDMPFVSAPTMSAGLPDERQQRSERAEGETTRPLRRDAERNRQRILSAARELFAERGVAVTLDDVAHRAELGVGTVYRRFASREQLVEAIFEEGIGELVGIAERALAATDSWQGLVDFLTEAASRQACDRGLRDVLFSSAYGQDRLAHARERLTPAVVRLVARAQADGQLRPDLEPNDIALLQLMIAAVADYTQQVEPGLWCRYLGLLLDGLRASRHSPTGLPAPAPAAGVLDEAMRKYRPVRH
jgi:AcrR family transcriptional regulator